MDLLISDFKLTSEFILPLLESYFELVDLFFEVVDFLLVWGESCVVQDFEFVVVFLEGLYCLL